MGILCVEGRCVIGWSVVAEKGTGEYCSADYNCKSGWCHQGPCVARADPAYYCASGTEVIRP